MCITLYTISMHYMVYNVSMEMVYNVHAYIIYHLCLHGI